MCIVYCVHYPIYWNWMYTICVGCFNAFFLFSLIFLNLKPTLKFAEYEDSLSALRDQSMKERKTALFVVSVSSLRLFNDEYWVLIWIAHSFSFKSHQMMMIRMIATVNSSAGDLLHCALSHSFLSLLLLLPITFVKQSDPIRKFVVFYPFRRNELKKKKNNTEK